MTQKPDRASAASAEAEAIRKIKARATPPEVCGPELPVAPAQGRLIPFHPVVVMIDAKGQEQAIEMGYRGRAAARVADVFDHMLARQSQAHREAHGPLFTPSQVAIGRLYRAMVEDRARGNLRGVDLMGSGGGGGDHDGWLAAFTDVGAQLAAMRRRVGSGDALPLRRVRPSRRGRRVAIPRLALVDQVCVGQMTLSDVLERAGWGAKGDLRHALRCELQECLDRMQGYPPRSGS